MINTVIGALIAAVITFGSGALALLTQDGVNNVSDISALTWIVLSLGTGLAFLKDFQAIWTRMMINKVTKSGDGAGSGSFPGKEE